MQLATFLVLSVYVCSNLSSPLAGKAREAATVPQETAIKLDKLDISETPSSESHEGVDNSHASVSSQDIETNPDQEKTKLNKKSEDWNPNEASMLKELEMALKDIRTKKHDVSPLRTETGGTPWKFLEKPAKLHSRNVAEHQRYAYSPQGDSAGHVQAMWREVAKRMQANQSNQHRFYINPEPFHGNRQEYQERQLQEAQKEEILAQLRSGEYDERQLQKEQEKEALAQLRLGVLHAVERQLLKDIQVAQKFGFTVDEIINDLEETEYEERQLQKEQEKEALAQLRLGDK